MKQLILILAPYGASSPFIGGSSRVYVKLAGGLWFRSDRKIGKELPRVELSVVLSLHGHRMDICVSVIELAVVVSFAWMFAWISMIFSKMSMIAKALTPVEQSVVVSLHGYLFFFLRFS